MMYRGRHTFADILMRDLAANSFAAWADVNKRMTWLSFMPGEEGTEFWLDDVWLAGVAMRDLIVP